MKNLILGLSFSLVSVSCAVYETQDQRSHQSKENNSTTSGSDIAMKLISSSDKCNNENDFESQLDCYLDTFLADMDGKIVPNPVADATYTQGAVPFCRKMRRNHVLRCFDKIPGPLDEDQLIREKRKCLNEGNQIYKACLEVGGFIVGGHYDCDDFSTDFQTHCTDKGIPVWGVGCVGSEGGHAFAVVQQPKDGLNPGECQYCLAEPQKHLPIMVCWVQKCGTPIIPDHIIKKHRYDRCEIFEGFPTEGAGEEPYWEIPHSPPRLYPSAPAREAPDNPDSFNLRSTNRATTGDESRLNAPPPSEARFEAPMDGSHVEIKQKSDNEIEVVIMQDGVIIDAEATPGESEFSTCAEDGVYSAKASNTVGLSANMRISRYIFLKKIVRNWYLTSMNISVGGDLDLHGEAKFDTNTMTGIAKLVVSAEDINISGKYGASRQRLRGWDLNKITGAFTGKIGVKDSVELDFSCEDDSLKAPSTQPDFDVSIKLDEPHWDPTFPNLNGIGVRTLRNIIQKIVQRKGQEEVDKAVNGFVQGGLSKYDIAKSKLISKLAHSLKNVACSCAKMMNQGVPSRDEP